MQIEFLCMLGIRKWDTVVGATQLMTPFSEVAEHIPEEFQIMLAESTIADMAYYCFGTHESLTRPSFPPIPGSQCHYAECTSHQHATRITMTRTGGTVLVAYTCDSCNRLYHLSEPPVEPKIRPHTLYIIASHRDTR